MKRIYSNSALSLGYVTWLRYREEPRANEALFVLVRRSFSPHAENA